jgi:hypothetical protein
VRLQFKLTNLSRARQLTEQRSLFMSKEGNNQQDDTTEESVRQPEGTQPATIPGAENPESEEIKDETNPNTE